MNRKKFKKKIILIFIINIFPLTLLFIFILFLILAVMKKEIIDILYFMFPILLTGLFFIILLMESIKLIWILFSYKKETVKVTKYLKRKEKNNEQLQKMNRSIYRFRFNIKDRLYSDALLEIQKKL